MMMMAKTAYNETPLTGSEGINLATNVLRHMDRINFLVSIEAAHARNPRELEIILKSIKAALRFLESMLAFSLGKSYYEKKKDLNLPKRIRAEESEKLIDLLGRWYDLLVRNLGASGLLPVKKTIIDIYEGIEDLEKDDEYDDSEGEAVEGGTAV